MTPETTELLDDAILSVLDEHGSPRFGLSDHAIKFFLPKRGFRDVGQDVVDKRLAYLASAQLAAQVDKRLHAAARCWVITHQGEDYLRTRGL